MRAFHHKLQSGFGSAGYCSKHFTGLDTLRYASQLLIPRVYVTVTVRDREIKLVILKKNMTQLIRNKLARINPGKYHDNGVLKPANKEITGLRSVRPYSLVAGHLLFVGTLCL